MYFEVLFISPIFSPLGLLESPWQQRQEVAPDDEITDNLVAYRQTDLNLVAGSCKTGKKLYSIKKLREDNFKKTKVVTQVAEHYS